jgi:hypothetical protein
MLSKIGNWLTKSSEKFESVISTVPTYSVEEIHEAFDKAEDEVIDECTKVLAELKIPTETQIEKKADLMKSIGFNNSETVAQAQVLKDRTLKIKEERLTKELVANTINEFRVSYPKEKFITEDKLNELCKKYNLMYAPVKNYIKDVPEKNLLDIKNRKLLTSYDICKNIYIWGYTSRFRDDCPSNIKLQIQKGIIVNEEHLSYRNNTITNMYLGKAYCVYENIESFTKTINKSGLFVAAPKSHFNLEGISKENEYGFFDVKHVEVKDPIVFEFCKNNLVRIVTKWGTEDDQSFLDPIVQNSMNN